MMSIISPNSFEQITIEQKTNDERKQNSTTSIQHRHETISYLICDKFLTKKHIFSANMTLINFIKGMLGPGCLSLPIAFKLGGLWVR